MEGLGNDMILLSSLVGKIVSKAAREFYLSVVVNITSDLGQCIKQILHAKQASKQIFIYQKLAELLIQRVGSELHGTRDYDLKC